MSFQEIKNIKNKDKLIKDYLATRHKIKNDFENEKIFDYEMREETEKLFKPVTSNLNKNNELVVINNKNTENLINKLENNQSNVMSELKALKQPKLIPFTPNKQLPIETNVNTSQNKGLPPPLIPEKANKTTVSHLIASYLKDKNRTENGYSIRYHSDKDRYSIGNQYIMFNGNQIVFKNKKYDATEGLMELMTKPTPIESKISETDFQHYKQILSDTNAMYVGFQTENMLVPFNKSLKYKLIKEKLFPNLFNKNFSESTSGQGCSNIILPSNPNQLVDQLKLSVSSYQAGNNGEFNRINAILDSLLKMNIISNCEFNKIYKNVF